MTEMNYILTTMTSRSLIIIDELCRSTSVEEGTAMAMSICEDLARLGAYAYVTTHYTLLTKLADLFLNIKVWQMQTIPSGDPKSPKSMKLDYKYNLIPGSTNLRGYGIYLVRNIWPENVLKHVDELQSQLTRNTNDPKFPSIDMRVRLKYDLECTLTKLKLKKKLTVTNLNKHITDYNNKMAKIGETPPNSQMIFQDLHCLTNEGDESLMDHSIFNASKDMMYQSEVSKIYLDNIRDGEEIDALQDDAQSVISSIHPEPEEFHHQDEVVLSPVSVCNYLQTSLMSLSKAKQRMQEVFTPDINLEEFQSQSTYRSLDPSFKILIPEVNLSCSTRECSLNLTENALNLKETNCNRIGNIMEDNLEAPEPRHPLLNFATKQITRELGMESPFTTSFMRPLQSHVMKTSTPLITKIKHNARDFGSSSTSTRTFSHDKTQVTTPKLSFTILNNVQNVDLQSIQDDLESFVEYMQNEAVGSDEDVTMWNEQNPNNNITDISENNNAEEANKQQREINSDVFKSINSEQNAYKYVRNNKMPHIFPAVTIIEGPKYPSFDESDNGSIIDNGPVAKPTVRNLQSISQEGHEEVLIAAFNSLSELKNPVLPESIKSANSNIANLNNRISTGQVDCGSDSSFNINRENTENVNQLIEAFNSLSNLKITDNSETVMASSNNEKAHLRKGYETQAPNGNNAYNDNFKILDRDDQDNTNESHVNRSDNTNFIENQHDSRFAETEESSIYCYESASMGHSPLASQENILSNHCHKSPISIANSLQKRVYHSIKNCEDMSKMNYMERIQEIVELPDEKQLDFKNNWESVEDIDIGRHNDSKTTRSPNHISNSNKPVISSNQQEPNESFIPDYDKSTEEYDSDAEQFINNSERKSNFYSNLSGETNSLSNHEDTIASASKLLTLITNPISPIDYIMNPIDNSVNPTENLNSKLPLDSNTSTGSANECKKHLQARTDHSEYSDIRKPTEDLTLKFKEVNYDTVNIQNRSLTESVSPLEYMDNESKAVSSNASQSDLAYDNTIKRQELMDSDDAGCSFVSATDVIETVKDKDACEIEPCDEAVQKEKELLEKVIQLKRGSAKLNQVKPAQHIPYLSVYNSSSSGNSSKDSFAMDLNNITRKDYSGKPTLGIAKSRRCSKNLKHKKMFKTRSLKMTKTIAPNSQSTDAPDKSLESSGEIIDEDDNEPEDITDQKRRKPSPSEDGCTSISARTTQNRILEEKTVTSVSEASKLRNLDGDFSSSSSGVKKYLENASRTTKDCEGISNDEHQEKAFTSISDASRKRNLDQSASSSDKRDIQEKSADQTFVSLNDSENLENSNEPQHKKTKMFIEPDMTRKAYSFNNKRGSSSKADATPTQDQLKQKFIPPSKLSKKAIQEAFYEEDRKFFESSGSSTDLAKMWEERLRRPSLRQIQRSTCLATLRKTDGGVEVIPEKEKKVRKNFKSKGKFLRSSSGSVNMNIFSDKNAETFDQFIKSNKKDFKLFDFSSGYGETSASRNGGNMFNFQQVNPVSSEHIRNRQRSEEFISVSQYSNSTLPFLTPNDFTLTPEGFYKDNRDDINQLLRKYN